MNCRVVDPGEFGESALYFVRIGYLTSDTLYEYLSLYKTLYFSEKECVE
ncbi:MAG: hypothetical protein PHO71_14295 [Bacteroides sp.]|nr:hypothetical protein [Bacteroides sp.]